MAGALGIEPSSAVLETVILPMYDAPLREQLIVYLMNLRLSTGFYDEFLTHLRLSAAKRRCNRFTP